MWNRKDTSYSKGLYAEFYAIFFLSLKLYKIMAWRYRSSRGEVDIIAKKGKQIVIVEVKSRKNIASAIHSINYQQAKRVTAAARSFLYRNDWLKAGEQAPYNIRFDVIIIRPYRLPLHLKSYFRVTDNYRIFF